MPKNDPLLTDSLEPDSFEEVLRREAHVSGPVPTGLGIALITGSPLLEGRLRLVRRLGEGGTGVVYEAYDAQRQCPVALKTLNRLDAGGIYRLKNEFRSLSAVSHEGLCHLYELFGQADQWFFTMELIPGERFDHWVRPGARDEDRLRAALRQLVAAVSTIHAAGKLHRDLKPSNVLVTPHGRVVVLDFGLASDPQSGGVGQTIADNSVSGTPAYMAPEQAAGLAASTASDFYALGVMLFEALTGQLPFAGRAHEMLVHKQDRDPPHPATIASDAPSDLVELCAHLLSRDPRARPDADRVRAIVGGQQSPLPAASHPVPTTMLVGRNAELSALHAAFAAASEAEKPVAVLLAGEPGIGKTALLEAFLDELREADQAVILSGRCYERERVPFKGFDVLIDELSRYLRKLPAIEAASLMPRDVYALRRLFPVLGRIQAVAQAPDRRTADAFELRRRAFLALGELLGRLRDRRPVVLAVDDLQWSDEDSTTLLLHLLRQPEPPRILLIGSHRAEAMESSPVLALLYQALLVDVGLDVRQLSVGPLPEDAAAVTGERCRRQEGEPEPARLPVTTRRCPLYACEGEGGPV